MRKTILQERYSCSVQKTAQKKTTKYSRNDVYNFENRPSCKGYSLGKMLSLGQKFKMPKTYEKLFYKNVTVGLCKKPLEKKTQYLRNETRLKIGHLAKAIAHAKAIALEKYSVWVKNLKCQKHAKNHSLRTLQLICAKNRSKKHQIFEK